MKGYRTILFGALMVTAPPLLSYLGNIHWADYVSPEVAPVIIGLVTIALRVVTTTPVGGNVANNLFKVLICAFALSLFLPVAAKAGDVNAPAVAATSKALAFNGYPTTRCGAYYGVGTGGSAGAINTSIAGTQIVQGDLDAMVGYTCPLGSTGFWFVEGQAGFANLNGGTILANNSIGGLSVSGPAVLMERVGAGSPLNAVLSGILPSVNALSGLQAALPSIPTLQNVTLSPANPYVFAGLVEADYGVTLGLASGHQWMVSPMLGVGNLQRASNNVMLDYWAGFQFGSTNSFCGGGGTGCAKLGNMVRVGTSVKF